MKRTFLLAVIFICIGAVCGHMFKDYSATALEVFSNDDSVYFLQEGSYSNYDIITSSLSDIRAKLVLEENNKYNVYFGITKDIDNANKIISIYEELGYDLIIKETSMVNLEFLSNIEQFDILVRESDDMEDIITIEEVVLANYEEIFGI